MSSGESPGSCGSRSCRSLSACTSSSRSATAIPPGRSTSTATSARRRRRSWTATRRITRPSSPTCARRSPPGTARSNTSTACSPPIRRPGCWSACPFTALPVVLAEWLWIGCLLAAGGLALRLAGVRDWRVYAAALVMPPVVGSLFYGAVDLLLLLGLAACWRWRDSAGKAGCALGAIIALKLIALPLVLWFVATRRWRAAGLSLAVAGALAVAGWAVVGLGEIGSYPHLLSLLTDIESARGFSAVAFASAFGAGASHGRLGALRHGRRTRRRALRRRAARPERRRRRPSCSACSRRSRSRPSSGSTRSCCCSPRSRCCARASA